MTISTLSAYTVLRDAYRLGYPFVETILSVIDHVDEYVVGICGDEDSTDYYCRCLLHQFPERLRTVHFPWPAETTGGTSIARAQDIVLERCSGDYCWLVQADEVYWPDTVGRIRSLIDTNPTANSFTVPFDHPREDHNHPIPGPSYNRAIRIIRGKQGIGSADDGWTFRGPIQPVVSLEVPKPVVNCWSIGALCGFRKDIAHAMLYQDRPESAERRRLALDALAAGLLDPPWTRPIERIPPILRGIVGVPEYHVRPELLDGRYRRLLIEG